MPTQGCAEADWRPTFIPVNVIDHVMFPGKPRRARVPNWGLLCPQGTWGSVHRHSVVTLGGGAAGIRRAEARTGCSYAPRSAQDEPLSRESRTPPATVLRPRSPAVGRGPCGGGRGEEAELWQSMKQCPTEEQPLSHCAAGDHSGPIPARWQAGNRSWYPYLLTSLWLGCPWRVHSRAPGPLAAWGQVADQEPHRC